MLKHAATFTPNLALNLMGIEALYTEIRYLQKFALKLQPNTFCPVK